MIVKQYFDFYPGYYQDSSSSYILADGRREFLTNEQDFFESWTGSEPRCGALLKDDTKISWRLCNNPDSTRQYLCEYKGTFNN